MAAVCSLSAGPLQVATQPTLPSCKHPWQLCCTYTMAASTMCLTCMGADAPGVLQLFRPLLLVAPPLLPPHVRRARRRGCPPLQRRQCPRPPGLQPPPAEGYQRPGQRDGGGRAVQAGVRNIRQVCGGVGRCGWLGSERCVCLCVGGRGHLCVEVCEVCEVCGCVEGGDGAWACLQTHDNTVGTA